MVLEEGQRRGPLPKDVTTQRKADGNLVASQGFEPRLIGSEPTVLPLNEEAILMYGWSRQAGTYDLQSF